MKKYLILALSSVFIFNLSVMSQNTQQNRHNASKHGEMMPPPPMREKYATPQQRAEKMAKELNLSDAQKNRVADFFVKQDTLNARKRAEFAKKGKEMKKKMDKKRDEMRKTHENEMKAHDAELESIIGKDKMNQWKQIREQKMQERKQRMMNNENGNTARNANEEKNKGTKMNRHHGKKVKNMNNNDSIPAMK